MNEEQVIGMNPKASLENKIPQQARGNDNTTAEAKAQASAAEREGELNQFLIKELGSLSFKDRKIIKEAGTIPHDLLVRLILKNSKKKRFNKIMLLVLSILLLLSMILSYFFKEESLPLTLFGFIVLIQTLQLVNHPDYKNNSKKELIYNIFKTYPSTDKET